MRKGVHGVSEGGDNTRVGWSFEEVSDLVAPPLNLVLYMHLRIFAYTSNVLIASSSFKYMELILASSTLKNLMFLLKSRLSTDRPPVMKLTCSTFQLWRCITVLIALRRETVLDCTFGPDEVLFTNVAHAFVFQNTEGPSRVVYGWEDRYSVRPHLPETFLHDCFSWDPFFDSSIFYRRDGTSHFTGSFRVPYRLLCQIQVLHILEVGCDFIPYSLEAFLA
jgi:hypothetical protein